MDVVSFKIRDKELAEDLYQQAGYLWGYPSSGWGWMSALLDGTVPFEDLRRWVNESYEATVNMIQARHNIPYHMNPWRLFDAAIAERFKGMNKMVVKNGEEIGLEKG